MLREVVHVGRDQLEQGEGIDLENDEELAAFFDEIESWAYVRELLMRLHADETRFAEMLPDRWAAQDPEAVLTHRLEESRAKAADKRDRRRRRRTLTNSR